MRIALGSDERTTLTDSIAAALADAGHTVVPVGPIAGGEEEWAEVSAALGRLVASGDCRRGVLFCFSGTGASIAANKVPGVRAALCGDAETARLARRYNHANVLVLSLRATSESLGGEILGAFLGEPEGEGAFNERNVAAVNALDAGS
ncbi:MAG: RpiB/LacA/LacB family sugar-phosphate isomerase [Actinobacteria bacterium]|nr:RpiB/LacA/LacB family sugar-phosphate isomerase [Actinomycetota bacterium]